MRNNVFNLVSSYVNWIIANYQTIVKINAAMPALRLIAEERDKKIGEICFKIQIAGKNIFPVVSLQDLNNSAMISNFSKSDQEIIRSYHCYGKHQLRKRISARTYDRVTKQFMYTIEYFDSEFNVTKCITIDNLALLMNEKRNFDREDICLIESELKKESH